MYSCCCLLYACKGLVTVGTHQENLKFFQEFESEHTPHKKFFQEFESEHTPHKYIFKSVIVHSKIQLILTLNISVLFKRLKYIYICVCIYLLTVISLFMRIFYQLSILKYICSFTVIMLTLLQKISGVCIQYFVFTMN